MRSAVVATALASSPRPEVAGSTRVARVLDGHLPMRRARPPLYGDLMDDLTREPPPRAVHDRSAPEHPLDDVLPGEARVLDAAHESLAGRRRGVRALWPFLGPAFIAAVAYVDPGNFATNMAAGATSATCSSGSSWRRTSWRCSSSP